MTQIKKTLSIAGIIAIVTTPVMAEIASTQYVQNALSGLSDLSYIADYMTYEDDHVVFVDNEGNYYPFFDSYNGSYRIDTIIHNDNGNEIPISFFDENNDRINPNLMPEIRSLMPPLPDECKTTEGTKKCALVAIYDSDAGEDDDRVHYEWEVVRSTSSGQ